MNIGDKIKDTYLANALHIPAADAIGIVIAHPTDNGKVIVVFPDDARVCDIDDQPSHVDSDWILVDSVREVWDALHAELRSHIKWLAAPKGSIDSNGWGGPLASGAGQKIRAVKLLREITGLGLADAKRAVETFPE